jgi:hypothetical protein
MRRLSGMLAASAFLLGIGVLLALSCRQAPPGPADSISATSSELPSKPTGKQLPDARAAAKHPVIMVQILTDEEPEKGDEARIDDRIRKELKKRNIKKVRVVRDWFRLTRQTVSLTSSRRLGTLNMHMAEPRDEKMLMVILDGSTAAQFKIPRKKGASKFVKHEVLSTFASCCFYLALRVEDPGSGTGPETLEIGSETNGKSVEVKAVSRVIIKLSSDKLRGYNWEVASIQGKAVRLDGKVRCLPYSTEVHLRVISKGKSTLKLAYYGLYFGTPTDPPEKTYSVTLDVQDLPVPASAGGGAKKR